MQKTQKCVKTVLYRPQKRENYYSYKTKDISVTHKHLADNYKEKGVPSEKAHLFICKTYEEYHKLLAQVI